MKKVLQQLKQYKRDALSCVGLTALEVVMEILLPFVTARIIDEGLETGSLPVVYRYGVILVVMAFLSLIFGALANLPPVHPRACRPIYGRRSITPSRPFPFPILPFRLSVATA